jgi:hypothetical protein
MTRDRESISATAVRALCAAVLAVPVSTAGWAANTVVFRCLDAHLSVIYTDLPCKDGQAFDTRAGEADPVAVARLERVRDALEQSAAQRIIDERRLAGQKELAAQSRRDAGDGRNGEDMLADGGYGYAVAGYLPVRPHPTRHRSPRPSMAPGAAPNPPYIVPRP